MRRPSLITGTAMIALIFAAAAFTATACGGDDADPADSTPVATAVPFDRNLLSGVVLNPADVPEGYTVQRQFAPEGASYTTVFIGDGLRYQSTAVRFETNALAEEEFQRNRKVLPAFGAREANYQIPGTDTSFIYEVYAPPGLAAWAVKDNVMLFLQIAPMDAQNPNPAARDQAEFARIAAIVGQRTAALVDAPERITPVAGATIAPPVIPSTAPTP